MKYAPAILFLTLLFTATCFLTAAMSTLHPIRYQCNLSHLFLCIQLSKLSKHTAIQTSKYQNIQTQLCLAGVSAYPNAYPNAYANAYANATVSCIRCLSLSKRLCKRLCERNCVLHQVSELIQTLIQTLMQTQLCPASGV